MNLVIGILILLICCIGNAEWWVVLINRRHALKFRHSVLHRIRKFHDFGLTVIPVVMVAFVGFGRNGLLVGGTWSTLAWPQQGLLLVTGLGFVPFSIGVIRFQLRKVPAGVVIEHSVLKRPLEGHLSDEIRQSMYGEASNFVRNFPGNQIWQLEVNRKRFQIPHRQPATLEGLEHHSSAAVQKSFSVAHFSDVHLIGQPGRAWQEFVIDELIALKPDAFVFTGDLLDRMDWLPFVEEQFQRISQVAPGYFILGNHDWHLDWQVIRNTLKKSGWIDLNERHLIAKLNGCDVLLAGTEAPWLGENPVVPKPGDEDFRILLSHAPDQRDYAVESQYDLMLSGHNHGGQIALPVIGPVYSPSQFGVRYAGGIFQHQGMLMHVSRGTGAKDPLRFRCAPEISLLTIQHSSGSASEGFA
ncbi:MAG: metallophosphoesterase [Fuerstiella sp.]